MTIIFVMVAGRNYSWLCPAVSCCNDQLNSADAIEKEIAMSMTMVESINR